MSDVQQQLLAVPQDNLTSDDYYTPRHIFEALAIRFDLDVCAPPGGVEWIPADRYYTLADDGLAQPWEGRVWMNPPYSNPTPWVRRFIQHRNGIALVPTGNGIWFDELWHSGARFALGERYFKFVNGTGGGLPLRVWFVAFGAECVEAIGRLRPHNALGLPLGTGLPIGRRSSDG